MKAVVIGATGATGKPLLEALLKDDKFNSIVIFVRRKTILKNKKLKEIVTDFSDIGNYSSEINGDVFFSCLGTTLRTAGSKEAQWKVDYDIPLEFAKIAKKNGIHTFVLVSAYNANAKSKVFYSKMKGELENKIKELNFDHLIIFRPGLLDRPNSDRITECLAVGTIKILNKMGMLKNHTPLPTFILAEKMIKSVDANLNNITTIELDNIFTF